MAAARHNLSRRALLGAGVVAPVLLARGGAVSTLPFGPELASASQEPAPSPPVAGPKAVRQAQGERAEAALRRSWEVALARFRRAEAALAHCRAEQAALPAALRAWPYSQALDDAFGRLEDLRLAALRRLLRAPAPDLAALALKIDLLIDDQAWELTGAERCLARLRADARGLANAG
jgi:hypothetical protein